MRPVLFAAGAFALALAALLVFQRGGPAPAPRTTLAPAATAPPLASSAAPTRTTPAPVADVVAIAAPPVDAEFPPPTPDQIMPRPDSRELAPAELRAQKLASLDLIARSIERLERERQAAARAGDDQTARLNQIRIERLQLRHEELEQAPGTAQPSP